MREHKQRSTLFNYLLLSLPVFYLFVLWEGGHFDVITLSNSSFLLALALSILATFQWLHRERVFAFFILCCKKFFIKGQWKNEKGQDNKKKTNHYVGYELLIATVYYCFSFVLLIF
jgi:hypothetical protein